MAPRAKRAKSAIIQSCRGIPERLILEPTEFRPFRTSRPRSSNFGVSSVTLGRTSTTRGRLTTELQPSLAIVAHIWPTMAKCTPSGQVHIATCPQSQSLQGSVGNSPSMIEVCLGCPQISLSRGSWQSNFGSLGSFPTVSGLSKCTADGAHVSASAHGLRSGGGDGCPSCSSSRQGNRQSRTLLLGALFGLASGGGAWSFAQIVALLAWTWTRDDVLCEEASSCWSRPDGRGWLDTPSLGFLEDDGVGGGGSRQEPWALARTLKALCFSLGGAPSATP